MPESEIGVLQTGDGAWRRRVHALIMDDAGPVEVLALPTSGVDFVVSGLGSAEAPLAWFRLDERDSSDPASQGAKLADAMARAIGTVVFGYGLPLPHAVAQIARLHSALGPFVIAVSGAQFLGSGKSELLRLAAIGSHLVLAYDTEESWKEPAKQPLGRLITHNEIAVEWEEFLDLAGGRLETAVLREAYEEHEGEFLPLVRWLAEHRGGVPVIMPQPGGAIVAGLEPEVLDSRLVVDALFQKGRAVEAFELAVRSGHRVFDELVDAAGWAYFSMGLHERHWQLLSSISARVRHQSDVIMRWYFAGATAVNRHNDVKAEVAGYLKGNEAPELRALFAAAFPGPDIVQETRRAVAALESPTTLRLHAFALALAGSGEEGPAYLHRALRLSEVFGQDALVVACATDLADHWLKRGCYSDGAEWARWALDWHYSHGLRDEIRRLVATALLVYANILRGQTAGLDAIVEELDVSLIGIPTSEAIVSTRADWAFVHGDIGLSERLYGRVVDCFPLGQFHNGAIDYVQALFAMGRLREAGEIGRRARVVTRQQGPIARHLGLLAAGLSLLEASPAEARACLEEAQLGLVGLQAAPRLAQASIALAKLHVRAEREEDARHALAVGEPGLRELGFTGWTLLGGFDPEIKTLYHMFRGETTELELSFLGKERITYRGRALNLGLRQCECLVVLASRPDGVAAERLGIDVYGETVNHSTLKAIVSRLRQAIPVQSRPYRLGASVWADFVEVQRLLEAGRVREAMSLYRGPLLPRSDAPAVVELRDHIDESIRRAVLRSGDVEALLQLAKQTEVDLELYEAALERLSPNDPRFAIVRARVEQVRRSWAHA
jgi:hypothetical protein